jgi:hypothetical protein
MEMLSHVDIPDQPIMSRQDIITFDAKLMK